VVKINVFQASGLGYKYVVCSV